MNGIDLLWPMMGAASLTLGLIHITVWWRQRTQPAHLVFSVATVSVAVLSLCELLAMQAATPEQYEDVLRWSHVPVAVLVVSLVGFVQLHFRLGWSWLGFAACALRVGALVPNFMSGANLNFLQIDALRRVKVWGHEGIAIPIGDPNPWMLIAQLSNLLLLLFLLRAIAHVWRRSDADERRRATLVCGSMAVFVLLTSVWTAAVVLGLAHGPLTVSIGFFGIVLVMGYELGSDVIRTAQLSRKLAQSEASLHDSEQNMQLAAQAAGLGLWTWDLDSNNFWFTDEGSGLLGFEPMKQVDRDNLLDRVHEDDRDAIRQAREEAIQRSGEFACEFRLVNPVGGIRWIAAKGRVEYAPSGRPRLLRGVILDITDRLRSEQEAALHRDELAHLSRVAMLGEISGSLAHELNQPLTAILSNAQAALRFLDRDPADLREVRESLVQIVDSDKSASEVIRRLRAMLRKDKVDYQTLAINEIVQEVLRLLDSDLLSRNVAVALDLQPDLPQVRGDRVQLQQVLLNLIINACDAMSDLGAGRRLRVGTRTVPGPAVEVSISDIGRGIPPHDLERIFMPFVTSKADGIGLGLAICGTIIRTHRGKLWATNNPSRGATLHFELPVE